MPSECSDTALADVREQVLRQPDAPALLHIGGDEHRAFTYAELWRCACSAAQSIVQALGGSADAVGTAVADFCDEPPLSAIALLGVGLSRCVVVPLDPGSPSARLCTLLDDCAARLAVCPAEWEQPLATRLRERSRLLLPLGVAAECAVPPPPPLPRGRDPVHLIYTSGSSGVPKAVRVEHAALRAYARAKQPAHRIGVSSRVMLVSAHTWDPCIGDVYSTLAAGATLCTAPRALLVHELGDAMRNAACTHVLATPSLWSLLSLRPAELPALRFVALGGEPLPLALAEPWLRAGVSVANTYGVTEATCYSTIAVSDGLADAPQREGGGLRAGEAAAPLRGVASAGLPLLGTLVALRPLTESDGAACGGEAW